MSRPGFVLEVDERTPPLLVSEGAGCRLERLPLGTRVAYPAESRATASDPVDAIGDALAAPLGQPPVAAQLRPGMKLALVFTDGSRPALRMVRPDVRTQALEHILTLAADAGVDDVRLVAANGLRRADTAEEIRDLVGERVHRSFHSDGLIGPHDAEAPDTVEIADGVRVNRVLAEADLVIDVAVVTEAGQTGWHQLATGLTGASTAWSLVGFAGGPERIAGVGRTLAAHLRVCHVEIVVDQHLPAGRSTFLGKREWEWNIRDRVNALVLRRLQGLASHGVGRSLSDAPSAPYGVLAVHAGAVDAVAAATGAVLEAHRVVEIGHAADVVIAGPAPVTEHNQGVVMNPLIAAWDTLAHTFAAHTGTPAVRPGGVMILFHPLSQEFSARCHAASADFFDKVLPLTTDAATIRNEFEAPFVTDEWYVNLYRTQHAFHGTHPLQLWYALQAAVAHCSDIIWVGADRASAERMGFRAASTLPDALEIASAAVGRTPDILHLHTPPALVADAEDAGLAAIQPGRVTS